MITTRPVYKTKFGKAFCADCLDILSQIEDDSINLVITSPPFALRRKKSYGNVSANKYCEWFMKYADEVYRVLKNDGSFVLDIGGSWNKGVPTRSLYHFDLLLNLCDPKGKFRLAQEFYWYNPAKMPAPAQWVTIERIRVKDSVNPIWWLAKTDKPNASNLRVLKPYTKSMENLLKKGYNDGLRPSGHIVSECWNKNHNGAIPPNLIQAANTRSSDDYLNGCRKHGLNLHPARFVHEVPEFFIKFLSEPGDVVLDIFSGSNVVGEVSEKLRRNWICIEINEEYVIGSAFRFLGVGEKLMEQREKANHEFCENSAKLKFGGHP